MAEKVVKIENEIMVAQPVEVLVTNPTLFEFPLEQDVFVTNDLLDVLVTNFPALPYAVAESIPVFSDIVTGSRTTTGTLYTVPAGRVFRGSLALSACVAVAGNSQPSISTTDGTLHQITINGLALSSVASANTISDVYIHGGADGKAVTFTQGASGTSAAQIAGRLL